MRVPAHLLNPSGTPTPRRTGLLYHLEAAAPDAIVTPGATATPTHAATRPRMRTHPAPVKKLLVAVMMLACVGTLAGGTLATFNAQTQNAGNTFSTGTLILANTLNTGSACYSAGGSSGTILNNNSNAACDSAPFAGTAKPGDSATATITLKNSGSVSAATLKVFMAGCTPSNSSTQTWYGTGNPCSALLFSVEEDTSTGTPISCVYGTASGSACTFTGATSTISTFQTAYNSSSNGLSISGGLASGASRYFKVGLMLPSTVDNTYQGRTATFDVTWYLNQT